MLPLAKIIKPEAIFTRLYFKLLTSILILKVLFLLLVISQALFLIDSFLPLIFILNLSSSSLPVLLTIIISLDFEDLFPTVIYFFELFTLLTI
jgi:hypothetical protein